MSYWRHLVPLAWVSQDLQGALGEVLIAASQHTRIKQVLEPLFSGLAFSGFFWCKVRTAPFDQAKMSRDAAAWLQPLAEDVRRAETPSLPSELNSSCPIHDTFCLPSWKPREHQQICWKQNLMATFFSQCQTLCWCHVPGTHLSARAGSHWQHWPLLAFNGFSRFTQQLTQASLTPQWKQILNKQGFFSFQKFF